MNQDDHCWSYGSINHPSTQSRKISIGVMVVDSDSMPKLFSEASKQGDTAQGLIALEERTPTTKQTSPWVTPKSRRPKLDAVLPSDDDNPNKFSGVTYERKKKKDPPTERMQDFTFGTVKDLPNPVTQMTNENGTTLSLKLRLQELLGAVSSPKDHSLTPELGADLLCPMDNAVLKPAQSSDKRAPEKSQGKADTALFKSRQSSAMQKLKVNQMGDTLLKPRQNSDTIETDSDSPDHRVERPVTRSLTQWKAPTKKTKTTKSGQSAADKLKHQAKDKTISSLDEDGFPRRPHATVGATSTLLTKKKNERKCSRVEPLNLFKESDVQEKIQKVPHWSVSPPPAPKSVTLCMRHSHSHVSDKERDCERKKNIPNIAPPAEDQDYQYMDIESPENKNQQEDYVTPFMSQKENTGSPLVRNFAGQQDGFHSPTFRFDTPTSSSSPSPISKTNPSVKILSFRTPHTNQMDDAADKPKDSLTRKASSSMKHATASVSEDSGNSEEESPTSDEYNCCTESDTLFQETSAATKLKFMLRPAIRPRNKEINVRLNHTKTSSPCMKGSRESSWIPKSTQHDEVDVVTRALELIAVELEKLKSKIKSVTSKKSSEILMSVAEDVHQQLQNAETHIQTDMGKLKNLNKLKRKRVESRFEEQQERLQLIHAKFKEQINQLVQDCNATFEGVEADHKEFKVTLEKTKTSHRKLVLQVEESIEVLLGDAQKKIAATHEVARKKMLQLKQVLGWCLK